MATSRGRREGADFERHAGDEVGGGGSEELLLQARRTEARGHRAAQREGVGEVVARGDLAGDRGAEVRIVLGAHRDRCEEFLREPWLRRPRRRRTPRGSSSSSLLGWNPGSPATPARRRRPPDRGHRTRARRPRCHNSSLARFDAERHVHGLGQAAHVEAAHDAGVEHELVVFHARRRRSWSARRRHRTC